MDTRNSLLACGITTALALSQSNDELQPACVVEPITGVSVTAECPEKQAPPLHVEREINSDMPTIYLQGERLSFRTGVITAAPQFVEQPAAFVQPMRCDLIVTDPSSFAPTIA